MIRFVALLVIIFLYNVANSQKHAPPYKPHVLVGIGANRFEDCDCYFEPRDKDQTTLSASPFIGMRLGLGRYFRLTTSVGLFEHTHWTSGINEGSYPIIKYVVRKDHSINYFGELIIGFAFVDYKFKLIPSAGAIFFRRKLLERNQISETYYYLPNHSSTYPSAKPDNTTNTTALLNDKWNAWAFTLGLDAEMLVMPRWSILMNLAVIASPSNGNWQRGESESYIFKRGTLGIGFSLAGQSTVNR